MKDAIHPGIQRTIGGAQPWPWPGGMHGAYVGSVCNHDRATGRFQQLKHSWYNLQVPNYKSKDGRCDPSGHSAKFRELCHCNYGVASARPGGMRGAFHNRPGCVGSVRKHRIAILTDSLTCVTARSIHGHVRKIRIWQLLLQRNC